VEAGDKNLRESAHELIEIALRAIITALNLTAESFKYSSHLDALSGSQICGGMALTRAMLESLKANYIAHILAEGKPDGKEAD
jgi:hypothetical protein